MSDAYALAAELAALLAPDCDRVAVAGSVRRNQPDPKDIELVAIPRVSTLMQPTLFGESIPAGALNHLELAVARIAADAIWEFDPVQKRNGPHWKRLRHGATGRCCDLFLVTAQTWGAQFALRTGPGDFNTELMRLAHRRGLMLDGGCLHRHTRVYDTQGKPEPCPDGPDCRRIQPTPDETDFFFALGLPWVEPARRSVAWLKTASQRPGGNSDALVPCFF